MYKDSLDKQAIQYYTANIYSYLVSFIHTLYLVFFLLYSLRKLKLNPTYI